MTEPRHPHGWSGAKAGTGATMVAEAHDTQSLALTAIEDFLTGRLENTQSVARAARSSGPGAGGTGRDLEILRARELSAWLEEGFLSHLDAAAVIEEYYGRRVTRARRDLRRERPERRERYARARDSYRRVLGERQAVHTWLLEQGWDPDLNNAVSEGSEEVAGHYWSPGPHQP